ncbi:MAG: hypothetical protein AAFZ15_08705 [Bacteroidota bacterium]
MAKVLIPVIIECGSTGAVIGAYKVLTPILPIEKTALRLTSYSIFLAIGLVIFKDREVHYKSEKRN